MTKEEFYLNLTKHQIYLNEVQKKQFDDYYQLLFKYNQVMDLTNVIEENQVYERHFYDSICIAFFKDFNHLKVCDVGSGAGFPAIPLKIVFPKMQLTIIDSLNKRMNFLKEVVQTLHLENVEIHTTRVEEVDKKYRDYFDIVTARAVASLPILLELCLPLVKVNGLMVALKGQKGLQELQDSQNAMEKLKCILFETYKKEQGYNFYFKKVEKTSLKYPRSFSQIKKSPL